MCTVVRLANCATPPVHTEIIFVTGGKNTSMMELEGLLFVKLHQASHQGIAHLP
jgi:hypothetical protein